ncbi:hypothetical protein PJW08_09370 [Tenacibaculum finnmarkense]|nr:hypothetical protein PJW08_09370 [Tenacibaculum finnmarkense]
MKKRIHIILIITSVSMLATAYYLYRSNDITERKSRLMRHIKEQLKHKQLPINQFDIDLQKEEFLLTKIDYNIPLTQKIIVANCINNANTNYNKEEAIDCFKTLSYFIVDKISEETLIKSITSSYINNGLRYMVLGGFLRIKDFQNNTEDNSNYLKLVTYSGFMYNLRDPKKLTAFYKKNQPLMQNYVTNAIYKEHLQNPINNLLKGYQILNNAPDRTVFLKEVEARGEKNYNHSASENWKITFWERRRQEGNDKVIYKILVDVKKHYEEQ